MTEAVILDRQDAVATITLHRPEVRNALDETLCSGLRDALTIVAADDKCRLVVVRGAGGNFCAGADVSDPTALIDAPADGEQPWFREAARTAVDLFELPKITVACVEGVAVGAGMNLALACDLVVASKSARFSEIFARRGLSLDFGGSWLLPRIVGLPTAKRLALLADMIPAQEALELGLLSAVVPDGEMEGALSALVQRLSSGPTIALVNAKRLLNRSYSRDLATAVDAEIDAQMDNLRTEDLAEALRAFGERRDPVFTGR